MLESKDEIFKCTATAAYDVDTSVGCIGCLAKRFLHADHFAPAFASFALFRHFDGDLESAMTWRHGHHERLQLFLLILYSLFFRDFFIFL